MTTEEQEDKCNKEAEEKYPVVDIDSLRPLTHSQETSILYKNSSNLDRQTAYIAGCRSRQAEIEALKKEMSEMTNSGWYSDMNNKLFSAQERVEALTKERDESRENYESLMRSSLVVAEEYREKINALQKELEALREENRWIPVGERLPQIGEVVIVYVPTNALNYRITDTTYTTHGWPDDTTHWRPLPSLPK